MAEFLLIIGGMLIGFIIGIIAEYCAWEEQMAEYVNKADVLDIIDSMPQDLVYEHIYELKGVHVDIVHCSECVHRREYEEYNRNHDSFDLFVDCEIDGKYHDDDFFCADAIRRD